MILTRIPDNVFGYAFSMRLCISENTSKHPRSTGDRGSPPVSHCVRAWETSSKLTPWDSRPFRISALISGMNLIRFAILHPHGNGFADTHNLCNMYTKVKRQFLAVPVEG